MRQAGTAPRRATKMADGTTPRYEDDRPAAAGGGAGSYRSGRASGAARRSEAVKSAKPVLCKGRIRQRRVLQSRSIFFRKMKGEG